MKVRLDHVQVTAKSDGGLSFQPDPTLKSTYPVFSIEVFPPRPTILSESTNFNRPNGKNTCNVIMKKHIKCTQHRYMPRCWAKFVTNRVIGISNGSKRSIPPNMIPCPPTNPCQAFVLHARHATFYIFYAKFPNTYLRDIVIHGANYRQNVPNPQKITIKQSRPFRMRYPTEQAAFFRLLANILCYLVGGYSAVFYMAKDEWNPHYRKITGLDVLTPSLFPGPLTAETSGV